MSVTGLRLDNQWNDFLLRQADPYASAKYEILLKWLGDIRGMKALVVGSGSGEFAAFLAKAGADVLATDIDQSSVELTEKTAKAFNVQLRTAVSRLSDFKGDQKFDLVVATDVIEHIEDDRASVQQLRALLTPGGQLLVTVPALPALFGYHDEVLGHFRRYTRSTLMSVLGNDFEVRRLRYYGLALIPVAFLISRLLRKPYPVKVYEQAGDKRSMSGALIRAFFRWEKVISPPAGTSLLLLARPKSLFQKRPVGSANPNG